MKKIKSNKIILSNIVTGGYIYVEDGKIVEISNVNKEADEEYDLTGYYVSTGFIDIHTHGGGGYHFEYDVDNIIAACNFHLEHGTTTIFPTISADKIENMVKSVENIGIAKNDPRVLNTIAGVHLEGPYFSKNQAGAQYPDAITAPIEADYIPILEKYSHLISRWSYAPELDEGAKFAKALKKYGIVASMAHTDAIYGDIVTAMENNCKLVTHLYSCTSTVTRDHGFRRLGVIECAYLFDDMDVEIICDGKHLPPELIRLIYKLKGSNRIALITDSIALAGIDEEGANGNTANTQYIIEDGVAKLPDRSAFAGSIATTNRLVRVMTKEVNIPITEAVKMITEIPARIMHIENKGKLAVEMDADIVAFDENIEIKNVFAMGKLVK